MTRLKDNMQLRASIMALLLVGLQACSQGTRGPAAESATSADDDNDPCAAFNAVQRGEYPLLPNGDPTRYWADLEECLAPGGDLCERAFVLTSAMPSMAGPSDEELERQRPGFLSACRTLPEPVQRCLTSYAIAHLEECEPPRPLQLLNRAMDAQRENEGAR